MPWLPQPLSRQTDRANHVSDLEEPGTGFPSAEASGPKSTAKVPSSEGPVLAGLLDSGLVDEP
jgi:hypothetical protein